jgi:hypothetical protein
VEKIALYEIKPYICHSKITGMKRIISTGLLWVMVLVAVQPTLAIHFCGESFRIITFDEAGENLCCCMKEAGDSGCFHDMRSVPEDGVLAEPVQSCCFDYVTEWSTDDFRSAPDGFSSETASVFSPCLFTADTWDGYPARKPASAIQSVFPPGGFAKYGADLLAFICIFRI